MQAPFLPLDPNKATCVYHQLKIWPVYFQAVEDRTKTFDVRLDDGWNFRVGDALCLQEWNPETRLYTGRVAVRMVRYIHRGMGLAPGYAILGFA